MLFLGDLCYQTGSATAEGVSIDQTLVYTSTFKIKHKTKVTPFMLSEQFADLVAGINAPYFKDAKCLKAIFDIQAATAYNNPNWIQQKTIFQTLGNSGGYNENFNKGTNNYFIDSITFKDSNTNPIPRVILSEEEISVEIVLKNTKDAPFSNNNTKFELQFIKAPFDKSEYQANGRTLDENFIDDRALQAVGSGAINGDQFGVPDRQVWKSVRAQFIST
jgi:hypothetical protein